MQYIRNTKNMTLMIKLDEEAKQWVDSSYAVHPDMRSHTGIYMTLRKGTTYTASCKQKLPRAQWKQNWWLWMMQWAKYYGPGISKSHRDTRTSNDNIPRQQKYNTTSRKLKIFKFKENSQHKCTILLHSRQNLKVRSRYPSALQ